MGLGRVWEPMGLSLPNGESSAKKPAKKSRKDSEGLVGLSRGLLFGFRNQHLPRSAPATIFQKSAKTHGHECSIAKSKKESSI